MKFKNKEIILRFQMMETKLDFGIGNDQCSMKEAQMGTDKYG